MIDRPSAMLPAVLAALVCGLAAARCSAQGLPDGGVPNIVLIVADDLGYSDLGCYGSEILTPNLDRLARHGLRFRQFYNCGRSCPSRASLLTGLYPHQTGVGHMMVDYRRPGYRGNLNKECATLAELLGEAGYLTYACGKWHLSRHVGPEGPKQNWPLQRGFSHFYGTIHGGGSYFDPVTLTEDNLFAKPIGNDYYYTDAISDRAADYVEQAARARKPFFLYVAYTAPHWPLQAPAEMVSRYRGKYIGGWEELRKQRFQRMVALGMADDKWPLSPGDGRIGPWESNQFRQWHQRRMEVYAAQVDLMDHGIGRILDKIRQVGAERNTLVMFLSDNGASEEEITADWSGLHVPEQTRDGQLVHMGNDPNVMPGPESTFQSYGIAWANVSNTPFRSYKRRMHEGGIASPLIVYWPDGIESGGIIDELAHVIDIVPTCLQLARLPYPRIFRGYTLHPCEGTSLLPVFRGGSLHRGSLFWEHEGNKAVRDGKWKIVCRYPGNWELYDMETDRTETRNLAGQFPVVVQELAGQYDTWAKRCNVEQWRK